MTARLGYVGYVESAGACRRLVHSDKALNTEAYTNTIALVCIVADITVYPDFRHIAKIMLRTNGCDVKFCQFTFLALIFYRQIHTFLTEQVFGPTAV